MSKDEEKPQTLFGYPVIPTNLPDDHIKDIKFGLPEPSLCIPTWAHGEIVKPKVPYATKIKAVACDDGSVLVTYISTYIPLKIEDKE